MKAILDHYFSTYTACTNLGDILPEQTVKDELGYNPYVTVGKASVIHIRPWPTHRTSNDKYILFAHGRGCTIRSRLLVDDLRIISDSLGLDVISYEYPGVNPGDIASEMNFYQRIEEVFQWCKGQFPRAEAILWGQSLGSGSVCYLAEKHPRGEVGLLVLESPIVSGFHMLKDIRLFNCLFLPSHFLARIAELFMKNPFDNAARQFGPSLPILVLRGSDDTLIPAEGVEEMVTGWKCQRSAARPHGAITLHVFKRQKHDIEKTIIVNYMDRHNTLRIFQPP